MNTPSPNHVIGLDIARAAAILMVLASHCGSIFAGWLGLQLPLQIAILGFYGVELFFVLSGFLIGRLLIDLLARKPTFRDWRIFMVRRWMRTLPLYYVCLAALAVIWRPQFWDPHRTQLWADLPYYITMTQNLAWPQIDGWFAVTWSLTVEEWFYLTFSAVLLAAAALSSRRTALLISLAIFLIIPPILRALIPLAASWDEVTSKLTPLRFDAIAAGVLAASLFAQRPLPTPWRIVMLAAGLLLFAFLFNDGLRHTLHLPQPAWQVLVFIPTSAAFALCLPACAALTTLGRWLDRPARALSAQSYALYLIHLELMGIVGFYKGSLGMAPWFCILLSLVGIFGLSYVSYWYFERPILLRRPAQTVSPKIVNVV